MDALLPACLDAIARCNTGAVENEACDEAYEKCIPYAYDQFRPTGLNQYDVRKPCVADLCYDMNGTLSFFRNAEVRKSLGVHAVVPAWSSCTDAVGELFHRDYHRNFNWTIPPLLANNIQVMIYAGDVDYICNWIGNKKWVMQLEWPGKAGFNAAADVPFSVAGRVAGTERRHGKLSFVKIYDAGHMVPMDQPAAALYLVHQLLQDKALAS